MCTYNTGPDNGYFTFSSVSHEVSLIGFFINIRVFSKRMKPILALTGASGFLGRHLVVELAKEYAVRSITRHKVPVLGVHESFIGNLKEVVFLERALGGCQVVVHCAAVTNHVDPDVVEVNVNYTRRLVQAAKKEKVKKFVYISTENVTYHCKDPYTRSKAEAERLVLQKFPQALILRSSLIFGREDQRYLSILMKAVRSLPVVPVFPKSICTLQPIHVEDVAKLVHQGLKLNKKGTYTLVGAEPCSFAEVGRILEKYIGKHRLFLPIPGFLVKFVSFFLQFGPRSAKRLHFMLENAFVLRSTSVRKLEQEFKYSIPSFEERLKDIIYK